MDSTEKDSLLRTNMREWQLALVAWRTLVLQTSHPMVAAGVAQHSTYRGHPWRRLQHTLGSTARLASFDSDGLQREVARLDRSHKRIQGRDHGGRKYSAQDPATRGWVLITLYDSVVVMRRLAGDPLSAQEQERLYAEFGSIVEAFGLPAGVLPATAAEVPAYMDTMIREQLVHDEQAHYLLHGMLREAPAPRLLRFLGPAWLPLRSAVACFVTAITLADLPPVYRERFRLPRKRRYALTSRVTHRTARAVLKRLPDRWRYQPLPGGPVPVETPEAIESRGLGKRDDRNEKLSQFFTQVLDQTGDGFLELGDLHTLARTVCWDLDLPEEREAEVFAAFKDWWEHMSSTMDTDGDGKITCEEFVTATMHGCDTDPTYLDRGVHHTMRTLFRAADTDGNGVLDAEEYRILFGKRVHPAELSHGFQRLDHDGDGTVTEEQFITGFTEFFTARTNLAAGSHLLGCI